jgi:hypothetical protein
MITMAALLSVLAVASQAVPRAADLGWLAGCWELTRGSRHVVEQWTAPGGGTLMGMARTVADGTTTEWEFLLIRERPGGLDYVAKPSGQPEAVFSAVTVTKDAVMFENAQHDFPQRIAYRLQPDGGVTATTEGTMNGQTRTISFPYARAACGKNEAPPPR